MNTIPSIRLPFISFDRLFGPQIANVICTWNKNFIKKIFVIALFVFFKKKKK